MNQQPADELKRSFGFWSAISVVIGTIIGSEIFFKQRSVPDSTGTSTLAIAAWVFEGIITLISGLTVVEIGAQMLYTGGLYAYIEDLCSRLLGFLAGWIRVVIYEPAIIASVVGFISILVVNLFDLGTQWQIPLAVITVIATGATNLFENKVGTIFSIITTAGKMIPIATVIIFGLFWGHQNAFGQTVIKIHQSTGGFGVAVSATLLGYDGWILITSLGGEMRNPQKLLPRAVILGITAVLIIYTLITVGVLKLLPVNTIHRLGEDATTYLAVKAFGVIGGKLLPAGIIISIMGTLNGRMITFPRIAYAMARYHDLPFLRYLAYITPKGKSPVVATILIIILVTIMMFFFDPDHLSDLCMSTVYCFYPSVFFGIPILRHGNKEPRPFSTPLYPLVPIITIAGGIFVLVSRVMNDPASVILFIRIVIVGLPILYTAKRMDQRQMD